MLSHKQTKTIGLCIIFILFYAVVQFVYAVVCLLEYREGIHPIVVSGINVLRYFILLVPVVAVFFKMGYDVSKNFAFKFVKKHWILYLIYAAAVFFVLADVRLGDYSIYIPVIGLYLDGLDRFSDLTMIYIYVMFGNKSLILLYFLPLPIWMPVKQLLLQKRFIIKMLFRK